MLLSCCVCDVVLGVQWLHTLGPIVWDFSQLSMSFAHLGKPVSLRGLRVTEDTMEDCMKFSKSTSNGQKGIILQIINAIEPAPISLESSAILSVVDEFWKVFEEPKGLKPTRVLNPKIVLKKSSKTCEC